MNKTNKIFKLILLAFVLTSFFVSFEIASNEDVKFLSWRTMRRLRNIKIIPSRLSKLNGQKVKIRGYMIPFGTDNVKGINEFLLVPAAGMCIHVPPPPANQMIYVKMAGGKSIVHTWDAVKITGSLKIMKMYSQYGRAFFLITADKIN